jgi:IS4 transposase
LAGTQHRLKPLQGKGAAALPGQALVVLDPQRRLIRRMYACEDAHANERTLLPRVLADVAAGQCWLADRNFATHDFLAGIIAREATFVIRQQGQIHGEAVGRRYSRYEKTDSGRVREQGLRITTAAGEFRLRRITLELAEPTRDDERELHLLTNLPTEISAADVARLYRERWSIETAFMHLATVLRSEIETLAYPPAALFCFALGLVLYDVLRTLEAGLRAAHPETTRDKRLSLYYLGEEIAGVYRGMLIAIPPEHWRPLAELSLDEWTARLLDVARRVEVKLYFTHPPSSKPPPKPKTKPQKSSHNSTYRLLKRQTS